MGGQFVRAPAATRIGFEAFEEEGRRPCGDDPDRLVDVQSLERILVRTMEHNIPAKNSERSRR